MPPCFVLVAARPRCEYKSGCGTKARTQTIIKARKSDSGPCSGGRNPHQLIIVVHVITIATGVVVEDTAVVAEDGNGVPVRMSRIYTGNKEHRKDVSELRGRAATEIIDGAGNVRTAK